MAMTLLPATNLFVLLAISIYSFGVQGLEPLSWKDAYTKAKATLAKMSRGEKESLLAGHGWKNWNPEKYAYIGNTAPIRHLGIPGLKMQDSGGAFRAVWTPMVGTVTCWPSQLSLASTFDVASMAKFAEALGGEFRKKGANGILGPTLDLVRSPHGGRSFESLAGEDPYLGSEMAREYVKGVQSQGILTVGKHWMFNNQETNRAGQTGIHSNSVVDEQTAFELYYPPWEAAIDAGLSAVMCSYNRVDGVPACSNGHYLKGILKGKLGFQGFVMSDWWATHGLTLNEGLDQEQPGPNSGGDAHFTSAALRQQSISAIDEAATRILAVVHRMKLTGHIGCIAPDCQEDLYRDVNSRYNEDLAQNLTSEAIVLLRNEGSVLPLSGGHTKSVSIIGEGSDAGSYNPDGAPDWAGAIPAWARGGWYSSGGSGHCVAHHDKLATILNALSKRAAQENIKVIASARNDVSAGIKAAQQTDVAIVVVGTTSGESYDRAHLNVDAPGDELVTQVAKHAKRTVVIMMAPGAVVMPWRLSVDGILVLFHGGQATGSAFAKVLFGDHAPTGRLPVTFPEHNRDAIQPLPEDNQYWERLAVGYRSRAFETAYTFGHGLTYTNFTYSQLTFFSCSDHADLKSSRVCLRVKVTNAGRVPASTTPQLYVEFPPRTGQPRPVLKGFQRTPILTPSESIQVNFALQRRDLSFFNHSQKDWQEVENATVWIGESSVDIRLSLTLTRQGNSWSSGDSVPLIYYLQGGAIAGSDGAKYGENCHQKKTCAVDGMACFEKDSWWASCKYDCKPGIDKTEDKAHHTAWTCSQLGPRRGWATQPSCAAAHEDCRDSRCCREPGQLCYEKNKDWASCRSECTPGIHDKDPEEHRTPWSCSKLGKHQGGEPQCTAAHEDCRDSRCCREPGQQCYVKNKDWASCRSECTPGIHDTDPKEHRTPWSCSRLNLWEQHSVPLAAGPNLPSAWPLFAFFLIGVFISVASGTWRWCRTPETVDLEDGSDLLACD